MTPAERVLRGRLGALSVHARGRTNTVPARLAFLARFEREVDPNEELPPAERARRAEYARKAHFTRLALQASKARQRRGSSMEG